MAKQPTCATSPATSPGSVFWREIRLAHYDQCYELISGPIYEAIKLQRLSQFRRRMKVQRYKGYGVYELIKKRQVGWSKCGLSKGTNLYIIKQQEIVQTRERIQDSRPMKSTLHLPNPKKFNKIIFTSSDPHYLRRVLDNQPRPALFG